MDYHASNLLFGYRVLVTLGYLFVGLAIIVYVGGNWDEIPRAVRMFTLIILTAIVQIAGLRYWFKNDKSPAVLIFFLGNLLFGASIILIAQIYHLGERMPDGIYWWAVGSLPFAVFARSRLLMIQTLILAFILKPDLVTRPGR